MWHGSINTSTDTLVPLVETKSQNGSATITPMTANELISTDTTDAGECLQKHSDTTAASSVNTQKHQTEQFIADKCKIASVSTNFNILPKVHSSSPSNNSNITIRPNQLSTNGSSSLLGAPSSSLTITSTAFAEKSNNKIQNNLTNSNNDNKVSPTSLLTGGNVTPNAISSGMEESILILPEHQKLEISFSGKCEMIAANVSTSSGSNMPPNHSLYSTTTTATTATLDTPTSLNVSPYVTAATTTSAAAATTAMSSQRRRRTSSSNSKRDAFGVAAKQINSRFVGTTTSSN